MSQKRTVPTTGVTATSQLRICETAAERKAQTAKAHFKYPEVLILPRVRLPLGILPSGATPDTLWGDAGSRCLRTPANHLGHRAQQKSGCALLYHESASHETVRAPEHHKVLLDTP